MTRLDLDAVEAIVHLLATRIAVSPRELPTFGVSEQTGRPHIEVAREYHYVVAERGQEISRKFTAELDLLLFWVFSDITFGLASKYERENRTVGEDQRRVLFAKQEEFLGLLSLNWMLKARTEHDHLLIAHSFSDGAGAASAGDRA